VIDGDEIVDVCRADDRLPSDLLVLLCAGSEGLKAVEAAASCAPRIPLSKCGLRRPFARRENFSVSV